MKFLKNKIFGSIAIACLVTIISALFSQTVFFQNLHLGFTDHLFTTQKPSDDIVIVGIDAKSLDDTAGLGRFQDWRRTYYAQVIDNLEKADAKTIGLDILFSTRARGITEDDVKEILKPIANKTTVEVSALTAVLQKFIQYIRPEGHPDDLKFAQTLKSSNNIVMLIFGAEESFPENGVVKMKSFFDLIPQFKKLQKPTSVNVTFLDSDSILRRLPFQYIMGDRTEIPFAMQIVQQATGKDSLQNIPNENGMLINYSKNKNAFPEISFVDAYKNTFDPALVKGKIILIGATATSLQDNRATPVASVMPGVEIHANAAQTILDKSFLQNQSATQMYMAFLLLGLIIAFVTNYFAITTSLIAAILLSILYFLAAKVFFQNGTILNMSVSFSQIILTYLASLMYRYFIEYSEKRMLKKAFTHYVSPQVAQQIMEHPESLKLGGEKREVTVLFSDIENFTPFSEKRTPEEIVSFMNEYMDAMTKVVFQFGGTLDKYEGDAVMAFFGAPLAQPDHALHACLCAYEMQQMLVEKNKIWATRGIPQINTRVGLSTGEVIAGNMGSHERFEYTVMGDNVNLGSRLEAANKQFGTHILISEKTAKSPGVTDHFTLTEHTNVTVKGKEELLTVYSIAGLKNPPNSL